MPNDSFTVSLLAHLAQQLYDFMHESWESARSNVLVKDLLERLLLLLCRHFTLPGLGGRGRS